MVVVGQYEDDVMRCRTRTVMAIYERDEIGQILVDIRDDRTGTVYGPLQWARRLQKIFPFNAPFDDVELVDGPRR